MRTITLSPWAAGFRFLKGTRWHADQLWVTDVCGGQVFRIGPGGIADPAISVPDGPTGLAFLSGGSALIVTARSRTVFRWSGGALSAHCDLAPLVSGELTDIAIDRWDRAYVTTFDATEPAPRCFKTARISVTPDGVGRIAASGFALPNAVAISPDQRALIVCETFGRCLTRFNIDSDGGLGNRCTLQRFGAMQPILIAGFIIVGAALAVEIKYEPPFWVHAFLWGPLNLIVSLGLLRLLKGLTAALQYHHGSSAGGTSNDSHWPKGTSASACSFRHPAEN
jgi:hypothetical protein